AKKIWHDSWPLMLSSAAAFVYLKIDQVMIGKMMGEAAVGIYAASVKITEIFYFIPGIICGSLFPAIINAKKTDDYIYKKRLKSFYYFLGILGLLLSIIVVILSKPIINLLFGIKYIESIYILRVYIWSSIGLFLGSGITYHLMAENKTKLIFKINLLAMIINIVLNLILIPIYGLVGATIATLVAYSVAPIWMIFNKNKKIK
ncbi:MAG: polysaccharide biosynthesis C-terminal domain-containing protein, partial [Bacteroidetes bacterium]|nr:polysaccharide biosynthesis C-terminal domain-containing protein [Bacteroidota bacterium]